MQPLVEDHDTQTAITTLHARFIPVDLLLIRNVSIRSALPEAGTPRLAAGRLGAIA
jgi:hypothetical protein